MGPQFVSEALAPDNPPLKVRPYFYIHAMCFDLICPFVDFGVSHVAITSPFVLFDVSDTIY